MTKTPELKHHSENCHYRLATEVQLALLKRKRKPRVSSAVRSCRPAQATHFLVRASIKALEAHATHLKSWHTIPSDYQTWGHDDACQKAKAEYQLIKDVIQQIKRIL